MAIKRWSPSQIVSRQEKFILGRLKQAATAVGRQELRERVPVEHRQSHTCRRQGRHARYLGSRKNEFNLRRASAISNLEVIQRRLEAAANRVTLTMARAA